MKSYLLKCGKLYDGIRDELQNEMQILVKDDKIAAVGKDLEIPAGTEVIDLSNVTVTPGLIDAHVHPDFVDLNGNFQDRLLATDNWRTMATLYCANKTLRRGFTTIRAMGTFRSSSYVLVDAKRAIDEGWMEGSRLVVSQGLATTGSHGDMTTSFRKNPQLCDFLEDSYLSVGNGADFFRREVRKQKKYDCDFIKIMATGGFASPNDSPEDQQLSDEELEAIIGTARELRMTVTAHAYTPKLMQNLIRLGINGIEHGSMMDEDTARLMEESGTYLVPTFSPFNEIIRVDEEAMAKKPIAFQRKLRQYAQRMIDGRQVIVNSKIKLGYGTDFVAVHNNYECGYEYESMFLSGMDPFRILKAATSVNAEILERDDIGTIEVGKKADISAWSRDLLTDPKALLDCAFVMKDGVIYPTEKVE